MTTTSSSPRTRRLWTRPRRRQACAVDAAGGGGPLVSALSGGPGTEMTRVWVSLCNCKRKHW